MSPRPQSQVLWILIAALLAMSFVLLRLRQDARSSVSTIAYAPPPETASATQNVSLLLANDADGSVAPVTRRLSLPADASTRARVLIQALLDEYATPQSTHPLLSAAGEATAHPSGGSAIEAVYLMPLKGPARPAAGSQPGEVLAVVDLSASFADRHPSGIEAETLTLLSIIATLHANLPQIAQVRFLVGGQQRDTLAGHADLTRVYLASDSEVHP